MRTSLQPQPGRAVPGQARLARHSWAMPSAKKGPRFLTNKLWAECQLPVSEGGKAAPWRKAGSGHWKDLTLPGLVGFADCHGAAGVPSVPKLTSDKSCLAQADEAHFFKCLASKPLTQHIQRQTDINLIICSMVPNQRHDSNCTIPRHLDTGHISHSDVAVSIILCSCVPHSAQQCCSAFLSPKKHASSCKREGKDSLCSAASLLFLCSQMQLIFSAKL